MWGSTVKLSPQRQRCRPLEAGSIPWRQTAIVRVNRHKWSLSTMITYANTCTPYMYIYIHILRKFWLANRLKILTNPHRTWPISACTGRHTVFLSMCECAPSWLVAPATGFGVQLCVYRCHKCDLSGWPSLQIRTHSPGAAVKVLMWEDSHDI